MLGSLLFLIFTNCLLGKISSRALDYVNDAKIWGLIRSEKDSLEFIKDFTTIGE